MDELLEDFNPFFSSAHHGTKDDIINKGRRSFSTSTPIVGKPEGSTLRRSLSVSVCSLNDSGYAESLCSTAGSEDLYTDTTSSLHGPILQLGQCDTGFQSKDLAAVNNASDRLTLDRLSHEFHFHTLDFDIPEEEQVREKRSPNKSVSIRRYSLDLKELDEGAGDCDSNRLSGYSDTEKAISDLPQSFFDVLRTFQPLVPDRLIGRKFGIEHVDIMSELCDRSMSVIANKILDYLPSQDLCSMCQVSRRWREICDGSSRNKARKLDHLRSVNKSYTLPGKENSYRKLLGRGRRGLTGGGDSLATIQCVPDGQIQQEPVCKQPCLVATHRDSFVKAAETLKNDERLQKCPSCQHPSVVLPVQERGQCQNTNCGLDYCVKCYAEYHWSRPCVPVGGGRTKTASIGGKKSKKNLRRL